MTDANSTESNSNPTNSLAKPIIIGSCIIAVAIIAAPHLAPRSIQSQKVGVVEESQWPIPADEVAKQFQDQTSLSNVKVTVTDVRFSDKHNAYRVAFSFVKKNTDKSWSTETNLIGLGFGKYSGQVRSRPYLEAIEIESESPYPVSIQTPSTL